MCISIIGNHDSIVPLDPIFYMNIFLNKYKDDNIYTESQPIFFYITSPYYDLYQLNYETIRPPNEQKKKCNYTVLPLNIQSLPIKFDHLRMLIYELYSNNIEIDSLNIIQTTSKSQTIIWCIKIELIQIEVDWQSI